MIMLGNCTLQAMSVVTSEEAPRYQWWSEHLREALELECAPAAQVLRRNNLCGSVDLSPAPRKLSASKRDEAPHPAGQIVYFVMVDNATNEPHR